MAGHYARIYRAIWDDDEFLALTPQARLLYIAIFSHKKVNACGTVDHRTSRWAASTGLDPDDIEHALHELEDLRFIAVDHATSEIVVRTYVRHDISAGQPNMAVAVWNAWSTIESRHLRRWILDELPAELWEATHRGGKAKGQSAVPPAALTLRYEPINDRSNDQHEGCRTPSERSFEPPSERSFGPPSEPPTPTPTPTTNSSSRRPSEPPYPPNEPVPPGPAAAAAPRPVDQQARAAVLTDAVAEVARRRYTRQRAQTARQPTAWLASAINGIRNDLIEAGAQTAAHQGATPNQLADLIEPPATVPANESRYLTLVDTRPAPDACPDCAGRTVTANDEGTLTPCPTCTAPQTPEPA